MGLVIVGAAHGRELPVGPAMTGAGLVGLLLFLRLGTGPWAGGHHVRHGGGVPDEHAGGPRGVCVFSGLGILLSLGRGQRGG